MTIIRGFLTAGLLLGLGRVATAQSQPHDRAYWRAIADAKFAVPAGASAPALAHELSRLLGSRESELRDDLAYSILTNWIYQQRLFDHAALMDLEAEWRGNLTRGIGETSGDGVLLRSFSTLMLSIVAALDNAAPVFTDAEYRRLLDAGLEFLRSERDLRGFDAPVGWVHATAHTADLLKFLARSPKLEVADQRRLLDGLITRLETANRTYVREEPERLARVAISIVARTDLDREGFKAWLKSITAPDLDANVTDQILDRRENLANFLARLTAILAVNAGQSEPARDLMAPAAEAFARFR